MAEGVAGPASPPVVFIDDYTDYEIPPQPIVVHTVPIKIGGSEVDHAFCIVYILSSLTGRCGPVHPMQVYAEFHHLHTLSYVQVFLELKLEKRVLRTSVKFVETGSKLDLANISGRGFTDHKAWFRPSKKLGSPVEIKLRPFKIDGNLDYIINATVSDEGVLEVAGAVSEVDLCAAVDVVLDCLKRCDEPVIKGTKSPWEIQSLRLECRNIGRKIVLRKLALDSETEHYESMPYVVINVSEAPGATAKVYSSGKILVTSKSESDAKICFESVVKKTHGCLEVEMSDVRDGPVDETSVKRIKSSSVDPTPVIKIQPDMTNGDCSKDADCVDDVSDDDDELEDA